MNVDCPKCGRSFRLTERPQNRRGDIACPRCGHRVPVKKKRNGKLDLSNHNAKRRALGL